MLTAAALLMAASGSAVGTTAYLYQRFAPASAQRHEQTTTAADRIDSPAQGATEAAAAEPPGGASSAPVIRQLPADASLTILAGSYPLSEAGSESQIRSLTERLEASGFHVYFAEVDLGARGRWQRVLAGAYTDSEAASRDVVRLHSTDPASLARVVSARFATGMVAADGGQDEGARRSGI